MKASRRDFLWGTAAFCLGGWRLFAAPPGWKPDKEPNLLFGVLSDTHLCSRPFAGKPCADWPVKYFAAALEYFKSLKVDAVVHCGDMAHRGRVREMEFHGEIWREVFGKCEPVKLFVAGNHDFRTDCAGRKLIDDGMAANWERIWGEKYEPVWHKEVRGHHFFGRHWGADEKVLVEQVKALWEEARSENENMDAKPFFLLSHNLLRPETCTALNQYRNAVGFFGHWHHSAANWREIYFVKGSSFPCIQVPTCHPLGDLKLAHGKSLFKVPISGTESAGKARQGFVVRVYDDMMVIERREFGEGGSLGADWVMPLGTAGEHPFSMKELKKVIGEPQFREGAKLAVEEWTNETKGEKGITIKIPLADGNPDSRVYAHEVVVVGDGGKQQLLKAVYAAGCNLGIGHEPNGGVTTLEIPKSELPPGNTLDIAVRPFTSLGTSGKAIAALAVRSPMTSAPEPQNVPELMRTFAGSEVKSVADWEGVRAPELRFRFEDEEYGRRPVVADERKRVSFETYDVRDELGGKAIRKLVRVTYKGANGSFSFPFTAYIPKSAKPAPAFVLACNIKRGIIDEKQGLSSVLWPVEEIVSRGYATAAFRFDFVAADKKGAGFSQGVFPAVQSEGERGGDSWATLSAWAWGDSRILDWMESEPLIDAKRVGVVGHSRGGKTAIWAGVTDNRFAMVCANNSGCSGAKLNHIALPESESIKKVLKHYPHWFCGNYGKYVDKETTMDFDQHELLALIAPRLLCIASATEDHWAGQRGEWWGAKLASPAWELYGKKGLVADSYPAPETPQQEGCISYHLRTGKHFLSPYDWHRFMDFADRHGWRA